MNRQLGQPQSRVKPNGMKARITAEKLAKQTGKHGQKPKECEEERMSEKEEGGVSHHLQQGQVTSAHVVKVDLDVLPPDLSKVLMHQGLTLGLVVDHIHGKILLRRLVKTVVVLARKQVDPHDTENQPKDEANQQHIHNGRDGTHQGVDYHLDQTREDRI